MSATIKTTLDNSRPAASQSQSFVSSGKTPPPNSVLASQLATDSRLKSVLHRLALVLPLTLLIFTQALRNPAVEIKLPILDLKVSMQSVTPIFFLIVCYMIFRAIRYSRLVLFKIFEMPSYTNRLIEIVVDNADSYKINSAFYDETLDPVAAELIEGFPKESRWTIIFSKVLVCFNVSKACILYGLIFSLLLFIAFYVSGELLFLITQEFANANAILSIGPSKLVDFFVLCLSAVLLLLGWLNATIVVLVFFLIMVGLVMIAFMAAIHGFRAVLRIAKSAFVKESAAADGGKTVDEMLAELEKSGLLEEQPEVRQAGYSDPWAVFRRWILKMLHF